MGIISDILEYNREHHGRFYDTTPVFIFPLPEELPPAPRMVSCPICGTRLAEGNMVSQHLRSHANIHVYVRVNGSIVRDISYIQSLPEELTVVVLGDEKASVQIQASGIDKVVDFAGSVSLLPLLAGVTSEIIRLRVHHLHGFKAFTLYCGKVPTFENSEIDKGAYDLLFSLMNQQANVQYESFQMRFLRAAPNEAAHRYATGFHDYALAFDMLRQGKNAKQHLESALSSIAIFTTPMATTAKRVLALKMNSLGLLKECFPPSRFAVANWFFNGTPGAISSRNVAGKQIQGEYGVYIDSFTETFLEAIEAFRQHDFSLLDSIVTDLEASVDRSDRNDLDKLTLLKARMYKMRGMDAEARRQYEMLIDNPDFEKEARGKQL